MSVQFRKLFSGKNDIMSFQSPACECLQFQQHGNKEPGMGSNNAVLSAIVPVTSPELISFVIAFRARSDGLPRVLQGLKDLEMKFMQPYFCVTTIYNWRWTEGALEIKINPSRFPMSCFSILDLISRHAAYREKFRSPFPSFPVSICSFLFPHFFTRPTSSPSSYWLKSLPICFFSIL